MRKKVERTLGYLADKRVFVSSEEAASALSMSRSSLLGCLDEAELYLKRTGLGSIERLPRRGIRLNERDRDSVMRLLAGGDPSRAVFDFYESLDRRCFLFFMFLCAQSKITTEGLAERMGVSARTVSNDIGALRRILAREGIRLTYEKREGYRIIGNSFIACAAFMSEVEQVCPLRSDRDLASFFTFACLTAGIDSPAADPKRLTLLSQAVGDILLGRYERDIELTILFQLVLMALGMKCELDIGITDTDRHCMSRGTDYELARFIRSSAERALGVSMDQEVDFYLCLFLQTLPTAGVQEEEQNYPFELEVIAQKFVLSVSERYGYAFHADKDLASIIARHFIPLVCRMRYGSQIVNPVMGDIATRYSDLSAITSSCLGELERYAGARVSKDEASLITLYLASAIEKLSSAQSDTTHVVIVCDQGNALARLLQYKIMNCYNAAVVAVVSGHELKSWLDEHCADVDLIVSVADVDASLPSTIPVVRISPLLCDADRRALKRSMNSQVPTRDDVDANPGPSLMDLIDPSCFEILESVYDMDELIASGGELLRKAGFCDAMYLRQMIAAAHCFGSTTTILIAPGIIMPHAPISEHVHKTGFSFVRLQRTIEINGEDVSCALSLCTTSKSANRRAIQQLGVLLRDEAFIERLKAVKSYKSMSDLVTGWLLGKPMERIKS